jgi:hypothetical protein
MNLLQTARGLYRHLAGILRWEIRNPFMPIHWDEPYRFTRLIRRLESEGEPIRPGQIARLTLVMSALLMLNWLFATLNSLLPSESPRPESHGPPLSFGLALLVSILGSLVLLGFLYLVYLFAPRAVGLNKTVLLCIHGSSQRRWRYEKIARIRFDTLRLGEDDFTVMFVDFRDGGDTVFGVSRKADLGKTIDFLRARGVEVTAKSMTAEGTPSNITCSCG